MLAASPQMTKARADSWSEPRAFYAAARTRTLAYRRYARDARRCPVLHGWRMAATRDEADRQSHRLYHCAGCGQAVHICRRCDHGSVYCAGSCARRSRSASVHRAGSRYQRSARGATRHAARQRAWRARQIKKVTHQGSPARVLAVTVLAESNESNESNEAIEPTRTPEDDDAPPDAKRLDRAIDLHAARACDWGTAAIKRPLACAYCRGPLTAWIRSRPLRHGR